MRDLSVDVKRATQALIAQDAVRAAVDSQVSDAVNTLIQQSTGAGVLAVADQRRQVLYKHRGQAQSLASTVEKLSGELATCSVDQALLRDLAGKLGQAGLEPDELAALHGQLRELTRLHNRAQTAQRLADTMTKLHTIERRAHSIPDEEPERDPLEDMPDDELEARIARALAERDAKPGAKR